MANLKPPNKIHEQAAKQAQKIAEKYKGTQWGAPVTSIKYPKQKPMKAGYTGGKKSGVGAKAPKQTPFEEAMYGDREGWRETTYRQQFDQSGGFLPGNKAIGMSGEDLPRGALGWDWYGNPYYGDGLIGWWKGFASKISHPWQDLPEGELTEYVDNGGNKITKEEFSKQLNSSSYFGRGAGPRALTEEEREPPQLNIGKTFDNYYRNIAQRETPMGTFARGMQETVRAVVDFFDEASKKTEQQMSVMGPGLEKMGEGSPLPELYDYRIAPKIPKEISQKFPWINYAVNLSDASKMFSPVGIPYLLYNGIRAFTNPEKDVLAKSQDVVDAYQSGRILYSSWIEPAVTDEYIRRYHSGENPYLLAQELEKPLPELVGRLVFDPWNAVGIQGKTATRAGRILNAQDEFWNVLPELDDAFRFADNVPEMRAAEAIVNQAKVQQAAHASYAAGLNKWRDDYSLTTLMTEGKRYNISRRAGGLMNWLGATYKHDPDSATDALKALYYLSDPDNLDNVQKGISYAYHTDLPRPLFSRAGQETGELLRRIVGDDPAKFLKDLQNTGGDVEKMVDLAKKRMAVGVKEMLPTVLEREEAVRAVAKGTATAIQQKWAKLPALPRYVVNAAKVAEKMNFVYKPLNSFFAGVYMGLSPAYAFRNFLQNGIQIAIDEGVGALFRTKAENIEGIQKLLGGALPSVGGFSGGVLGVDVAEGMKRFGMAKVADWFEEWGGAAVGYSAVKRTMRDMMRKGMPDISPLVEAGMNPQAARQLTRMLIDNNYDVRATIAAFREYANLKAIPVVDNLDFLGVDLIKGLESFHMEDALLEILRGGKKNGETIAEVRTKIQAMLEKARRVATKAEGDTAVLDETANVEDLMVAQPWLKDIGEESFTRATHYSQANHNSIVSHITAVRDAVREATIKLGPDAANNAGFRSLVNAADAIIYDVAGASLKQRTEKMRDFVWDLYEQSRLADFDFARAFAKLEITGDVPENVSQFRKVLWEQYYFPEVRKLWDTYRETQAQAARSMIAVLDEFVGGGLDNTQLALADYHLSLARQWEQVKRADEVRPALIASRNRGDVLGENLALAHKYGYNTLSAKGVKLDNTRILNVINKNLPEGTEAFKRLEDVPPNIAEEAFIRSMETRAGLSRNALGIQPETRAAVTPEVPTPIRQPEVTPEARQAARDSLVQQFSNLNKTITPEQAGAMTDLIEANARYLGLPLDEYTRRYIDDITYGGVPGEHALLRLDKKDPNFIEYRKYLEEKEGQHLLTKDVDEYMNDVLTYLRKNTGFEDDLPKGALKSNEKTLLSIDITGNCPYTKAGRGCLYCYVENPRMMGSPKANIRYEQAPYNREILNMFKDKNTGELTNIEFRDYLNEKMGGLRVFSVGDTRPEDLKMLHQVVQDAQEVGLKLKMVTKQPRTLEEFLKYENVSFNLSIDWNPKHFRRAFQPEIERKLKKIIAKEIKDANPGLSQKEISALVDKQLKSDVEHARRVIGDERLNKVVAYGWDYDEALKQRSANPDRVFIRSVAMNERDAILYVLDPNVDVVTMWHGTISDPNKMMDITRRQNAYLAGIGPDRTKQLVGDMQQLFADQLPEGITVQHMFDYINNKIPITPELRTALNTKIGNKFPDLEKMVSDIRMQHAEAYFQNKMHEEIWPRMVASGKLPKDIKAPRTGQEMVSLANRYKIKLSDDPVWKRIKKVRDSGAVITLRQEVPFEAGGEILMHGTDTTFEDLVKYLNTYTYRPQLGERTTRALLSVFREKKPGVYWNEKAKGVVTKSFIEDVVGHSITDRQYKDTIAEAVTKVCCQTGRCGTCHVLCGTAGCRATRDLPEILYRLLDGEPVASIAFDMDGRAVIRAFKESTNVTDMSHELGHLFRRTLKEDDLRTLEKAMSVSPGKWMPEHEEKFAEMFEKYLSKGKAPTPELANVFEKFRQWIIDLYHSMTGRERINPEVKKIMDKMLGGEVTPPKLPPVPTSTAGNTPTLARAYAEQMPGLEDMFAQIERLVAREWNNITPVNPLNRNIEKALNDWAKLAGNRVAEARLIAAKVAEASRDFTLLSYPEKRTFDAMLGYLYPYHFWYNRTYAHWLQRVAQSPEVIAAYSKYREMMSEIHAGAPEWWKYNVNTNELLGLNSDNPLFFNLEATLNPLNGLTGVDFTDPEKRVGWWPRFLDDLNKIGPSTWTPFSMATAMSLSLQGEQDAAARWGGRLFPQTQTLKALLNLAHVNIPTLQGVNEFDPMVLAFSGGLDPYERNRVGRALGMMVEDGLVDQATADEAAATQDINNPVWKEAIERALNMRAPGQLASFLFGVGFKTRHISDIQIDRADREYRMIWAMADTYSPEELRDFLEGHRQKYPFYDAVILSRKGGVERDKAYAYNVLSRVPPGQKDDIAKMVGIDPILINRFYADKGKMDRWEKTDYQKFMAGIADIGAQLDMPDSATRAEWNNASDAWKAMSDSMAAQWGPDIENEISLYYMVKKDPEAGRQFLLDHPQVDEALDFRSRMVQEDPLLSKYYNSIDKIERYYYSMMRDMITKEIGDVSTLWDGYYDAQLKSSDAARAYWKSHPQLQQYVDMRDLYERYVAEAIVRQSKYLRENPPLGPSLRQGAGFSTGVMGIQAGLEAQKQPTIYDYTWQDWQEMLTPRMQSLIQDYAIRGEELPDVARKQLEYEADRMGIDVDLLIEIIADSLQ